MTGWRKASKPNANRLRPSFIDPTGLKNLGEVIVGLIDVLAFNGNRLIVGGNTGCAMTASWPQTRLSKWPFAKMVAMKAQGLSLTAMAAEMQAKGHQISHVTTHSSCV